MITLDKIEKMEELIDLTEQAKKHFGVTNDPHEAGYITHDGKMLDFSGRHRNSTDKSLTGHRFVDHRDVGEVDNKLGDGNEHPIDEFQRKTNALRVHISSHSPSKNYMNIYSTEHNKITPRQIETLQRIHDVKGGKIFHSHGSMNSESKQENNRMFTSVSQLASRIKGV